jgi:hypothetical protein
VLLRDMIHAFRPDIASEPMASLYFDFQIFLLEVVHKGGSCGMAVSLQTRFAQRQLAMATEYLVEFLHGRQFLLYPLGPRFKIKQVLGLFVARRAQRASSSFGVRPGNAGIHLIFALVAIFFYS